MDWPIQLNVRDIIDCLTKYLSQDINGNNLTEGEICAFTRLSLYKITFTIPSFLLNFIAFEMKFIKICSYLFSSPYKFSKSLIYLGSIFNLVLIPFCLERNSRVLKHCFTVWMTSKYCLLNWKVFCSCFAKSSKSFIRFIRELEQ